MNAAIQVPIWYHSLAPLRTQFTNGLPILMYHKVARPPRDSTQRGLYAAPELFRRQMGELRAAGFQSVPLDSALEESKASRIAITFDDGFTNVLDNTLETLRECGFRAIQFLVADRLGQHNTWDTAQGDRPESLMDTGQVRDWLAAGHAIGAHTLTHPRLSQLPPADARREIFDSKAKLEDLFSVPIEHFCYPYGDFSRVTRDLVVEAGYRTACDIVSGVNTATTDRFALRRYLAAHRRPGVLAWLPFVPATW